MPVYLGRISYALYLLQATPLARILWEMLNPDLLALPAMYANLSLLAAFFYQLIEQPCRVYLLRIGSWLLSRRFTRRNST